MSESTHSALLKRWGPHLASLSLGAALSASLLLSLADAPEPSQRAQRASAHHEQRAELEAKWTCSMHPQVSAPQAGLCPLCGMDLIPATEGGHSHGDSSPSQLKLNEVAQRRAMLATEAVRLEALPTPRLELWGELELGAGERGQVSAWVGGRVERLKVQQVGAKVKRGQVIAELYSPALYQAHQALLTALKLKRGGGAATRAAKERLRLLGVREAELKQLVKAKRPWRRAPLRSDRDGVVLSIQAREGAYVAEGSPLFEIGDMSRAWVSLRAPLSELESLKVGDRFELRPHGALLSASARGVVSLIEPTLNTRSRAARVRLSLEGELSGLHLGAVLRARLVEREGPRPLKLTIPDSAALLAGEQHLVYVEGPNSAEGRSYEARLVRLGPRVGGRRVVLSGLRRGERVVSRGAFTLDAEAQLRGSLSLMSPSLTLAQHRAEAERLEGPLSLAELGAALAPLKALTGAYLDAQAQLAEGSLQSAQAALKAGLSELERANKALNTQLTQPASSQWRALAPVLRADLSAGLSAHSLSDARARFEELTRSLERLLALTGNLTDAPIYAASCPMAFGGRGGRWLQRAEEVDNVYYGDEMRRCGSVDDELKPRELTADAEERR